MSVTVVHVISSLGQGSAEMLLASLLEHLHERPFKHHVIYFHDGPLRGRIERAGIETHRVKGVFFVPRLYRTIKGLQPDCIHTSLWSASLLGRIAAAFLHVPVVASVHTITEHYGRYRNFVEVVFPIKPERFVAISHSVKRSMMRQWNIPIEKITVVPNAIDSEGIVQHGFKGEAKVEKQTDEFFVGAVGRFIPGKNFEHLIESFSNVLPYCPSARLILVGTGPLEQSLRSLAASAAPEGMIRFIISDEAYAYYHAFDCLVQPSSSEGQSMALLEAVSIGLPVIVSAEQRRQDFIVDNKNGIVVPPNNVQEMTKALHRIITDADLRERLSTEAKKAVSTTFLMKEAADVYRDIFMELSRR